MSQSNGTGIFKNLARKLVFPAVNSMGIEKLFSTLSSHSTLILMYHGVVKHQDLSLSVNHISVSDFEKHLEYFSRNFKIISLEEAFDNYRSGKATKRKSLVITFDDGYENNYLNAYPLLKKYNFPATIFVTSQCLLNPERLLWYDQLDLCKSVINYEKFSKREIQLSSQDENGTLKIRDIHALRRLMKSVNAKDKELILSNVINKDEAKDIINKTDPEYYRLLKKDQIREMADSGLIEIGSHTVFHPNLDTLQTKDLEFELNESKKILQLASAKKINSIAFPDGAYNQDVKRMAEKAGYQNLLAAEYKIQEDKADKGILPRLSISNTTSPESIFIQLHMAFSKLGF